VNGLIVLCMGYEWSECSWSWVYWSEYISKQLQEIENQLEKSIRKIN